ncbi:hypothetical protein BDR26DRAFT_864409 [Obelidium mucronatum]|nr:hypothetical protein BDR26DRAFT_864409 [Obelidium mucronatum]
MAYKLKEPPQKRVSLDSWKSQWINKISPYSIDLSGIPCDNYLANGDPSLSWVPTVSAPTKNCFASKTPTDHLKLLVGSEYLPFHLEDRFIFSFGSAKNHDFDGDTLATLCEVAHGDSYNFSEKSFKLCIIRRKEHVLVWFNMIDQENVNVIVGILQHLSATLFPELCIKHGYHCVSPVSDADSFNTTSSQPPQKQNITELTSSRLVSLPPAPKGWFPSPDVVIGTFHSEGSDVMMKDLRKTFGSTVQNIIVKKSPSPISSPQSKESLLYNLDSDGNRILYRWFLRTTPTFAYNESDSSASNSMSREIAGTGGWGLIDWDRLLDGLNREKPEQSHYLVYTQAVLSRLEILGVVVY